MVGNVICQLLYTDGKGGKAGGKAGGKKKGGSFQTVSALFRVIFKNIYFSQSRNMITFSTNVIKRSETKEAFVGFVSNWFLYLLIFNVLSLGFLMS